MSENLTYDVPELDGWMSLPAAGDMLHVSRQRLFQMVQERKWESIHRIRGKAPEDPADSGRPAIYVVRTEEVERYLAAQRTAAEGAAPEPVRM
jgi:hypothetical protein